MHWSATDLRSNISDCATRQIHELGGQSELGQPKVANNNVRVHVLVAKQNIFWFEIAAHIDERETIRARWQRLPMHNSALVQIFDHVQNLKSNLSTHVLTQSKKKDNKSDDVR